MFDFMIKKDNFSINSNYINISFKSLHHNFTLLKKLLLPSTKIIAMVKSNAYGHGLIQVSKYLESLQVDYLGVFTISEAIQLRKAGIKNEIIIFGPFQEYDLPQVSLLDLGLVVGSYEEIKFLLDYKNKKPLKLHIKIDTGMGRIGFLPEDGLKIINSLHKKNQESLKLVGICTHFSDSSSNNTEYTEWQGKQFINLLKLLENEKITFPLVHSSNSAAILKYPQFHFNCVRPGILLYGIDPFIDQFDLKPVLSLHSFVSSIKIVPAGSFISYNRTFQTKKETRIAIVPIGYADGYLLDLSNKAYVSIKNKIFPIIGNICMNQFIVDISESVDIKIHDRVNLIDNEGHSELKLTHLAKLSNKIPYEILCRLSESLQRNYLY